MAYEEFFTDSDKPYAENLNDSLVLTDAFDLSVPLCMPDGFSNGEFSSTLNVTRKCNVGLVTLKSVGAGVTVGTSQISGSGEVVFRVYPNFNCFYKWDKILLEKSGTVGISFRKPDGSGITATVGSDGIISDSSALKQLQEIDVVFTLSSATINNILIWFVNNQGTRNRTGARLEASQLVNVNGTVSANDDKAVNGGTVKTALDNLHTTVTSEIEDLSDSITSETDSKLALKEDKSNKVTTLDTNSAHYPSCTAVNDGLVLKENLSNKVTSLDNSNSHYPTTGAIQPLVSLINDLMHCEVVLSSYGESETSPWFRIQCDYEVNMNNLQLIVNQPNASITNSNNLEYGSHTISNVFSQTVSRNNGAITYSVVHTPTNTVLTSGSYTIVG